MANNNLDDIIRNLTVFLKGQIPSLQGKSSVFELSQQVQNIVMNLRTSITQLEGASQFDFRSAPEYKALNKELETVKAAHQKLEESLFLEMNKNDRVHQERGRENDLVSDIQEKARQAEARALAAEGKLEQIQKQLEKLQIESRKPAVPSGIEPGIKAAYEKKISEAEKQRDVFAQNVREKESDVLRLSGRLSGADVELREAGLRAEALKREVQHLVEQREGLVARLTELEGGFSSERSEFHRVKAELEQRILQLTRDIESSPNREAIKNLTASSDARIRFQEKTIEELKKQLKDCEQHQAKLPDQLSLLQKDKARLEQHVIDLEAMIRRFSAERNQKEVDQAVPTTASHLGPEENVFFFEMLTQILRQLPDHPDFNELKKKAEEGISVLERHQMIHLIPTIGNSFNDRFHKVVRSFQTGMLEDGTIIYEVSRGYAYGDQIVQRALVWIAKSRFKCNSCGTMARGPDNFCPKCGLELCTPDGISKRKLTTLPATVEICLPLADQFLKEKNLSKAEEILDFLPSEKQQQLLVLKRRTLLQELKTNPVKEIP